MKLFIRISIVIFFIVAEYDLLSQQISRDVIVIKPYEPTISDAFKINSLPEIDDSVSVTPSFNYSILPARIDIEYQPKEIKPAKMTIPLSKLYKNYLKLGLGNYFTPLAEYAYNSLRAEDYAIGAYFGHISSHSKIKLDNEDKVPSGYSKTRAELFGKKIYSKSTLSGEIRLNNDGIHYYGYNTALFPDSFPDIKAKDIKQRYFLFGTSADFHSAYPDSSHFNYGINVQYDYFSDKYSNTENILKLAGSFSKPVGKQMIGINASLANFIKSESIDSVNNTVIRADHWFSKSTSEWKLVLGFNAFVNILDKTKAYIFPKGSFQINIIEEILIPYFGIDGYLDIHNYQNIANENPFITPGLNVTYSNNRFIAYAGLKGKLSFKSTYRFDAVYSIIDGMHFFVNDTLNNDYENQFTVVYDDMEQIKYHGEIGIDLSEKLNILLKGNYYKYVMTDEEKAWHKPEYNIDLNCSYNLKNKILVDIDLIAIGKRYAKSYDESMEFYKLDPVIDLNLGIEYRYSKILSAFLNLYNITSSQYYIWNQFPAYRFNFLAGITYKL
jgi:hypothetical protein